MNILFMCVANSARSQLAEGLARHLFPKAGIQSAGSAPAKLNPAAVQVLKEIDIDISRHFSKSIDELPRDFLASLDYVITLCAEEVCPVLVSPAKKLHWPMPDPAQVGESGSEERLQAFRETRDRIRDRLLSFGQERSL